MKYAANMSRQWKIIQPRSYVVVFYICETKVWKWLEKKVWNQSKPLNLALGAHITTVFIYVQKAGEWKKILIVFGSTGCKSSHNKEVAFNSKREKRSWIHADGLSDSGTQRRAGTKWTVPIMLPLLWSNKGQWKTHQMPRCCPLMSQLVGFVA